MTRARKFTLVALFLAACVLVVLLLVEFTEIPELSGDVVFHTGMIVTEDGTKKPFDLGAGELPELGEGEYYWFEEELTDFPSDGYIKIDVVNIDIALYADGKEFYRSFSSIDNKDLSGDYYGLPVPGARENGRVRLGMRARPAGSNFVMIPPMVFVRSRREELKFNMAVDYSVSVLTGVYTAVFLAVLGIFLLSVYLGRADWMTLLLSLAAARDPDALDGRGAWHCRSCG